MEVADVHQQFLVDNLAEIRTVLLLNAVPEMICQYSAATYEAYHNGVQPLVKIGLVNRGMLGSFILLYLILTLYGAYLMYTDMTENYCDPSDTIDVMETCKNSGPGHIRCDDWGSVCRPGYESAGELN